MAVARLPQLPFSFRNSLSLFFFQAEDGIRHRNVTGVQTCALPICRWPHCSPSGSSAPRSRPRTTQLLSAPAPRDRDLEALPLELERVVTGEAAEREHSLCIAAQILALHPPVLAQQLPQRVVAGLGGAVRAEQPRGRPEPGPGVAQSPVRQRFDRRL